MRIETRLEIEYQKLQKLSRRIIRMEDWLLFEGLFLEDHKSLESFYDKYDRRVFRYQRKLDKYRALCEYASEYQISTHPVASID
jgi:hypothetical protein